MTVARSNYKQIKITLTEEHGRGNNSSTVNIGMRVHVKPLEATWTERHLVLTGRLENQAPLSDLDAVYACLLELLACPPLPGHIG